MEKLQFKVQVEENLTSQQICQTLEKISKSDHSNYDCFLCFILSHGQCGTVYGVDDKPGSEQVKIAQILQYFYSEFCPSLKGKPKCFFLPHCQVFDIGRL